MLQVVGQSQSLSSLLHDTRNMIASMKLYCDLLEQPGVLVPRFRHYADDLRLVAAASERLLRRLTNLERSAALRLAAPVMARNIQPSSIESGATFRPVKAGSNSALKPDDVCPPIEIDRFDGAAFKAPNGSTFPGAASLQSRHEPTAPVADESLRARKFPSHIHPQRILSLSGEITANHKLVSAMVGPAITVGLSIRGGNRAIDLNSDDLTRILINLASNSAQAMQQGGHIQITLEEVEDQTILTFSDTGHGISQGALETVFEPGYSTRVDLSSTSISDPYLPHAEVRGQGLTIVRSLVVLTGGSVKAVSPTIPLPKVQEIPPIETEDCFGPGAAIVVSFPIAKARPFRRIT